MSDTEQLFIVAAVWTVIAAVLARFVPNWIGRIALFAVLVGVPFWELPYGYFSFRSLCEERAKLLVVEKILPQESVCVNDLDAGLYAQLTKAGFTRIEVSGRSDDPNRYMASGRVVMAPKHMLQSKYCLDSVSNIQLPQGMRRSDQLVRRVSDGQVVAKQSRFVWSGMWWQVLAHPMLGRGGMCFDDPSRPSIALRNGAG